MSSITVLIADEKQKNRMTCLDLLRDEKKIHVVGEARNGLEVLTGVAKLRPHILLLNLNLLNRKRISFLQTLRLNSPKTKVILLTRRAHEATILQALSYGVWGYLRENLLTTFLPKMVHVVNSGEAWVPRKMVPKIIDHLINLTTHEE
jgi:DNA-binding NarL/FixJ family response regulator